MFTHTIRWLLCTSIVLIGLSACQKESPSGGQAVTPAIEPATSDSMSDATPEAETERLNTWLNERYEEELHFSPMQLTMLGRKDLYDEIDDASEEAQIKQVAWREQTVVQLKEQFDYDKLSTAGKESYDLWVFQTEQAVADLAFMRHGYLFGELGGVEDWLPTFLINFHKVETEEDMQAYIKRISGVSGVMDQVLELVKLRAGDGMRPPRFAFETAIDRAEKVITGLPFNGDTDSPILKDAKAKIEALVKSGDINENSAKEMLAQVEQKLTELFQPAYAAFIDWLNSDMANADEQPRGVSALPNGEAYYNRKLATYTTLPMTAEDVHQQGLSEVKRILGEMQTIKESVGFDGDMAAFFEFIRTDPQFYYSNTDEGREGYLADTREFLAEIDEKLPEYFGILPNAELVVKRVEEFREVDGGAQHYFGGTPDGSRPGVYYVHMSDMSAYSKTDMETTAYHEGSPGHHMQVSIAQELTGIPTFRTQADFSVYSEGWALYSELLAKEMGQFKDPYRDFGRLTAEMWRAIRLVVDTGLHAKGWSQEQAEQFFFDNSAIPEGAVRSEVRRYLTTPGQATSYKIGMLKIQELRKHAEEVLGDQFDIRGFHDVVLGGGALPLPMLEARVNNWIAEQQS